MNNIRTIPIWRELRKNEEDLEKIVKPFNNQVRKTFRQFHTRLKKELRPFMGVGHGLADFGSTQSIGNVRIISEKNFLFFPPQKEGGRKITIWVNHHGKYQIFGTYINDNFKETKDANRKNFKFEGMTCSSLSSLLKRIPEIKRFLTE